MDTWTVEYFQACHFESWYQPEGPGISRTPALTFCHNQWTSVPWGEMQSRTPFHLRQDSEPSQSWKFHLQRSGRWEILGGRWIGLQDVARDPSSPGNNQKSLVFKAAFWRSVIVNKNKVDCKDFWHLDLFLPHCVVTSCIVVSSILQDSKKVKYQKYCSQIKLHALKPTHAM